MNAHLTDISIEMSAAQIRAAKIVANRRALAALLHHHGDRPPEQGCSTEALRIRQVLFGRSGPEAGETAGEGISALRVLLESARPAILELVAEVAARHDVPIPLLLAPPRRAAPDSAELRAQFANREAMYRAHEVCQSYPALGLHFGKHPVSIRRAAQRYARRLAAAEGAR